MTIPNWYGLLLLALAAYRTFTLLSEDDILDVPRSWLLGYRGWKEGEKLPASYRAGWAKFLTCPACFGFWVSVGWWGAYQLWPHGTLVAAVPLAVSALLIFAASLMNE